jgi:hypothetical protein
MQKTTLFGGIAALVSLLLVSGCALWQDASDTTDTTTETVVDETVDDGKGEQIQEVDTSPDITPYFEQGDVEFHEIEALSDSDIMSEELQTAVAQAYNEANGSIGTEYAVEWDEIEHLFNWYNVAMVKEENVTYGGWHVVVLDMPCEGPCFNASVYRFLWDEANNLIYLPQYSSEYAPDFLSSMTENLDEDVALEGLMLPETIELPGVYAQEVSSSVLVNAEPAQMYFLEGDYEVVFEDSSIGKVYSMGGSSSCFLVQSPDGSVARYEYDAGFGFVSQEKEPVEEVMMTWPETGIETNLTTTYSYMPGGCGIMGNCYGVVDVERSNLRMVGIADNGVELYTIANPKENASVEDGDTLEQETLAQQYETYKATNEWRVEEEDYTLLTFDEYVEEHAVLFWRDAFDRWSVLVHNDYKPMVECGKPVIYLYPTTTTEVNVQVGIDELTVSEPAYGAQGWTVTATPSGELTNLADGQTYPYLFWEGKSYDGITPTQGFMVARRNLESFLNESLMKMGLNATERADFVEFWLPHMQANPEPYVYVTFLGTQEFNKIAPLTITPKPTTLIRVFMYYRPVVTPFKVTEQKLSAIARRGFTVVEWGGTSSRPWEEQLTIDM